MSLAGHRQALNTLCDNKLVNSSRIVTAIYQQKADESSDAACLNCSLAALFAKTSLAFAADMQGGLGGLSSTDAALASKAGERSILLQLLFLAAAPRGVGNDCMMQLHLRSADLPLFPLI